MVLRPKKRFRRTSRRSRPRSAAVTCPSCFERIAIPVDLGGERHQVFPYDCEVCCRPMVITLDIDPTGNCSASAERES